jgi:CYTH domain-containing protein
MSTTRRFLIASPLARLLRRDRGGSRVTEGHFPNQTGRSSHVYLDGEKSSLVLLTIAGDGSPIEERTEVPRAHAEALLDVAPGKVDYARTRLHAAGREIWVDRFVTPGPLDLIQVAFESQEEAGQFAPPAWFGPEVTSDQSYQTRSIALEELPQPPEVPLSNAALDNLLDVLENRFAAPRSITSARRGAGGDDQPRRLSSALGDAPSRPREVVVPAPVPVEHHAASQPPAPTPAEAPGPAPEAAPASEPDLDIEDDVIRELARSLRPASR